MFYMKKGDKYIPVDVQDWNNKVVIVKTDNLDEMNNMLRKYEDSNTTFLIIPKDIGIFVLDSIDEVKNQHIFVRIEQKYDKNEFKYSINEGLQPKSITVCSDLTVEEYNELVERR